MAEKNLSAKSRDKQLDKIRKLWLGGNRQNAVNQCQEVLRNNPQHAPAHLIYAGFLRDSSNTQEAAKHYQAACGLPETTPECFLGFADFLKQVGQPQNAQEVLSVGFKRWPQNIQMARELGVLLAENNLHLQAKQTFEHCLQLQPNDWISWNHLGCCHAEELHANEALDCFNKSLALATNFPRHPANTQDIENIKLNKASALIFSGDTDAARQILESILAKNPESHRAWSNLSNLIKCSAEQIATMEKYVQKAQLSGDTAALRNLHFALGIAWGKVKDLKKSMAHLDAGNRIVRASLNYDSTEVCNRIRNIPDYFPPEIFDKFNKKEDQRKLKYQPVFIVGMPRCGSTLTEQILASHPQVIGAGEINVLRTIKKELIGGDFPNLPEHHALARAPEILRKLRESYLKEIERIAHDLRPNIDTGQGQILVVDKMLGNFDMIGMILQAIPEALIIHCRRNRIDTCISCYSMLFKSVSCSYDQKELAEFYNAYEYLMEYWHAHVPTTSLMESSYEEMVADPKGQAQKLLNFVNVPWDPCVLDFYKQKHVVSTSSMAQVRNPIYSTSVERWRQYEPYIQPMLNAFERNE